MLGVIIGVVVAVLLLKSGMFGTLNIAPGVVAAPIAVAPQTAAQVSAGIQQSAQQESAIATGTIQGATQIASSLTASGGALGNVSNSVSSSIPVIGAAFSLIASSLIAASQKRAKEAQNENQAVASALAPWDAAVAQIVAAYNAGTLTVAQTQSLLGTIMSNYWNEVTPQIQPGRNGCSSGSNCPPSATPNSSMSYNAGGNNYCSGSIGAACCVGCADLQLSVDNMQWAVLHANSSGKPVTAFVQIVYASKYGGVNRPAYTVTFSPPLATGAGI